MHYGGINSTWRRGTESVRMSLVDDRSHYSKKPKTASAANPSAFATL